MNAMVSYLVCGWMAVSEVRSRVLDEIGSAGEGGRRVSGWDGWMGGWVWEGMVQRVRGG